MNHLLIPTHRGWSELIDEIEATGGPSFSPLSPDILAHLHERFAIAPWLEELLVTGYPIRPISIGSFSLFPPPHQLLRYCQNPHWPAHWFPIDISDGHTVYFLRFDHPESHQIWKICIDAGVEIIDGQYAPPRRPQWSSFGSFSATIAALYRHGRQESLVKRDGERWLAPEEEAQIIEHFGEDHALVVLDFFGLSTVDDMRRQWESDRFIAACGMAIGGFFTALIASTIWLPIKGALFLLLLAAPPATVLFICMHYWNKARTKLRVLEAKEAFDTRL